MAGLVDNSPCHLVEAKSVFARLEDRVGTRTDTRFAPALVASALILHSLRFRILF